MKLILSLAIASIILTGSCTVQRLHISETSWLVGSWICDFGQGVQMLEQWKEGRKGELHGISYQIVNGDSTIFETIVLKVENDQLHYIVTAPDENGTTPIDFVSTGGKNNTWIFENPAHDYPQKITYTRVGKDSIMAEISGNMNGTFKAIPFPMKRLSDK
ncbi:MAG: hypothetical protein JNM00_02060 [Flavobacteriales bacterium]|nr:hypothetical protein [Flavobacteriales bacterium]